MKNNIFTLLLLVIIITIPSTFALTNPLKAKPKSVTIAENGEIFVVKGDNLLKYNREGKFISIINKKVTHLGIDFKNDRATVEEFRKSVYRYIKEYLGENKI